MTPYALTHQLVADRSARFLDDARRRAVGAGRPRHPDRPREHVDP